MVVSGSIIHPKNQIKKTQFNKCSRLRLISGAFESGVQKEGMIVLNS